MNVNTGLLLSIFNGLDSNHRITLRESPVTERRCTCCNSVIYSRRFPTCRECGTELPGEVLLNGRAAARLRVEVATSRERMRMYGESPISSPGVMTRLVS